jgi:hypothetical protein
MIFMALNLRNKVLIEFLSEISLFLESMSDSTTVWEFGKRIIDNCKEELNMVIFEKPTEFPWVENKKDSD